MRLIFLTLAILLFSGCGNIKRWVTGLTGEASEFCYEGVSYLQFPSGASVQYDKDGKVVSCQ